MSSTLSHVAALRLREEIIKGKNPPGTRLAEAAVAERLGMSRVPVREALASLEREGLISFSDTGRAFVRKLTPQDFEELYTLRQALEPVAARLAAPRLKADASQLEKNIAMTGRAKKLTELTRLDLDFHELILVASGNERLLNLWQSLRSELEVWLGYLHREHRERMDTRKQTVKSHKAIVTCFQTETPAACERLIRRHITGWRDWLPVLEDDEEMA